MAKNNQYQYENNMDLNLYDENTGNYVCIDFTKLFISDMHVLRISPCYYCVKINDRYRTRNGVGSVSDAEKEMVKIADKYNKFCEESGRLF